MCEKFSEFWSVKFKKICEFSREFLVVFLKKFTKFREFLGVRHCEQKQAAASFCVAIHYLTKSRFKYEFASQKRTACVMDCFEPFGSRNDETNFKFANLAKILNSYKNHKNLPPNLKQNLKSKYQKTKPQFLYLNSFKRQLNA